MPHSQLKLIVIRTSDTKRAVEFYASLGIDFAEERHGNGPLHFAADLDGVIFEIYPAKNPEDVDKSTRLGFSVSDLPGTMAILGSRMVEMVQEARESEWGLRAVVRDLDGRAVELYQK